MSSTGQVGVFGQLVVRISTHLESHSDYGGVLALRPRGAHVYVSVCENW